jgi:Mg2+ and Co2+ transporter CorA
MKNWSPKEIVILIITAVIFITVVTGIFGMVLVGPERTNEKGREILGNIIFALIGILSGWVGRSSVPPTDIK